MKTQIRCIRLEDKIPKGFRYLQAFECQWLLDNNFEAFNDLEKVCYYKLIGKNHIRWLWLHGLGGNSLVDLLNRDLLSGYGVRGVLVVNKAFKIGDDK